MTRLFNGRLIAKQREEKLALWLAEKNLAPTLGIFLVGNNPQSALYVKKKVQAAERVGITVAVKKGNTLSLSDALIEVQKSTDAVIVQLPLGLEGNPNVTVVNTSRQQDLLDQIDPDHDVDGLSSFQFSLLAQSQAVDGRSQSDQLFVPATTKGILTLLREKDISLTGKKVVILGKSRLVGLPTALGCLAAGASVALFHSLSDQDQMAQEAQAADVLISATGQPGLVTEKFMHPNQTVIDVGISYTSKGGLVGDVDLAARNVPDLITPVPGGVGPMTVQSLLENVAIAAARASKISVPSWLS